MMNDDCRRTAERLASYVDGLLPPGEQAEVEAHCGGCHPCRAAALREQGARAVLRDHARALVDGPLPPGLRSRCEAMVRERAAAAPAPRLAWLRPRFALTAAMTIIMAVAVFSVATHRSDTVLAAQLTADHAKCFRLFASGGARDLDASRVERMLEDDYGWDVHVPPSSTAGGIRLIGARRCLYADGWVPHVMYKVTNGPADTGRREEHDVSLFMLEGVARPDADLVALAHRSRIWRRGSRTFVLVWPAAAGAMTESVEYVMATAR